ncbi:MAG: serine/threonine-protein kinase [Kofleriaceae bacterium]
MTTSFGNYEILYELKSGGMGAVLLGRKRGPGAYEQLVAIKTIRPEFAQAPAVRAMFLDEAAILARLNHPGIATVHDFGEEGGTLYMVMEYVQGLPLRDVATHRMPPLIVARAIAEAARGLHAAHEARDPSGQLMGLVHRDISPDNLMLGYDGHIKVIDFGIALVKNRQAPVTEFGTVKGKPPYMSPEQVQNEPMDRRSDVWALGVVAWELLTGQGLFDGDSIYAIAMAVHGQELHPPSTTGVKLPSGLDAVVMGALTRDLDQRTQTAAVLAEQLEQVVQAAGGETLAAWADRELDHERTQHRAWLASVVVDKKPLPRAVSRPTDQPTQVGPVAAPAPQTTHEEPVLPQPTSFGGEDQPVVAKKNRMWLVLLLALLVAGGAVYLATAKHEPAPKPPVQDARAIASADAPIIVEPSPLDAALAEPDAAIVIAPIDAGGHTVVRHHDAGVVKAKPDAAEQLAAPPTGTGTVTIKFHGETFSNVTLDGDQLVPPVYNKKLSAGKHTIKFFHPKSGELLDTQVIEIHDGEHVNVTQH